MFTTAELSRRMARVRVLLETHDDVYDDAGQLTEKSTPSGFGEPRTVRRRCGVCGGDGCSRCEGGYVKVVERDPYDTGVDRIGFDPNARTRRDEQARIEGILDHLHEQELVRAGEIAHVEYETVLELAEARDRRGAYRVLRAALDVMPRSLRGDEVVRWLAEHMPGPIHVPRWAYEQELETLRDEVGTLYKAGEKVSDIAAALSVSQRQVKRLLREGRKP